jgi:regulator of protease activity HflC (stomatin/prohibitin superfamily)
MKRYFLMLFRRLKYSFVFFLLITGFLVVVLWEKIVYVTPVGHASVEWYSILGGSRASRGPLREGVHVIWPWNKFYTYDLRLQNRKETYAVVSQDGLHFDMDLNFRWHVIKDAVVILNQEIGPDYIDRLLIPEIGSVLRRMAANYTAEAIYTTERNLIQQLVFAEVTDESHPNGLGVATSDSDGIHTIILSDILITRIDLPENIQQAIERKLSEAELVKEYAFRVEREELESQRKAIEAEGIRLFQETVAPAITDSYLAWRGIEATLELAKSNNAKVIVIGNSETGLPLILDTGGEAITTTP